MQNKSELWNKIVKREKDKKPYVEPVTTTPEPINTVEETKVCFPDIKEKYFYKGGFFNMSKIHFADMISLGMNATETNLFLYIYSRTLAGYNTRAVRAMSNRFNTENPVGAFTYSELEREVKAKKRTIKDNIKALKTKNVIEIHDWEMKGSMPEKKFFIEFKPDFIKHQDPTT